MAKYISELQVSLNQDEEAVLKEKGFRRIKVDLNQGSRDNQTFIWFKRGTERITDIQPSYSPERSDYLRSLGYTLIEKNLNPDSSGDPIYLCYYAGHFVSGGYIVELDVTADPDDEDDKMSSGWERMGYELSRKPTGPKVYLWMRREIEASVCGVPTFLNSRTGVISSESGFNGVYEMTNRRPLPPPARYPGPDWEDFNVGGEMFSFDEDYSRYGRGCCTTSSATSLRLSISDVPDSPISPDLSVLPAEEH